MHEPRTVFRRGEGADVSYWSVWSCVLFQDHIKGTPAVSADQLQPALEHVSSSHKRWAVIMNRGGHFAAAVFDMRLKARPDQELGTVVIHKTFHRCVALQ